MDRPAHIRRPRSGSWLAASLLLTLVPVTAGCIGGRVLEGYPGYPFVAIDLPAEPDSTFYAMQDALAAEGFELDFSEPDDGLINTRPVELASGVTFLSVVVGEPPPDRGPPGVPPFDASPPGSRAWIAGYEPVPDGARRIDPLDEEGWAELRDVAGRLSVRLGGGPPLDPGAGADAGGYP